MNYFKRAKEIFFFLRTTSGQNKRRNKCSLEVNCPHKLHGEHNYLFQAKQIYPINTIAEF